MLFLICITYFFNIETYFSPFGTDFTIKLKMFYIDFILAIQMLLLYLIYNHDYYNTFNFRYISYLIYTAYTFCVYILYYYILDEHYTYMNWLKDILIKLNINIILLSQ